MNKKTAKSYRIWRAMKARCYAPSQNRGRYKEFHIEVCDRWRHSYENFIADMGEMPGDDYSIERIDIHKGYEPHNCKWIPQKEQAKNRSTTIWIKYREKEMCLKDVARTIKLKYTTLYTRYRRSGNNIQTIYDIINERMSPT